MINILKTLFTQLSDTTAPVYFETAPDGATFPYTVFRLPNSVDIESDRQDYTLQVDVWDNSADTTRLEQLTDQLDKQLLKLRYLDENHLLIFQRENRLMIPDPDPSIRRRQLRYVVKTYER